MNQVRLRGLFLRVLREQADLGTRELGDRAHLSPGSISNYETGKRDLTLERARDLAVALDVPVGALVEPWRLA